MTKIKRLLALALALCMALSLCACGDKEEPTPVPDPAPEPAPVPTPAPTPDPAPAPVPTPEPPAPVVPAPDPEPAIRPEIENDISQLRDLIFADMDALAQTVDPEQQDQLLAHVLEMEANLAIFETVELNPAEQKFYIEAISDVAGRKEPWLPLFEAFMEPPLPQIPDSMLQKIARLEQMYADTYLYISTGAAAMYGKITDYASYQSQQEALMGFFDGVMDRCLLEDPDTLIQVAQEYYTEAAQLPETQRDYAMDQFKSRVQGAYAGCIGRFRNEDMLITHYESCYIHFVIDDWQGSTPAQKWAAAKIAAQEQMYFFADTILGGTSIHDFHDKVAAGFAEGNFDVYNLMDVKT